MTYSIIARDGPRIGVAVATALPAAAGKVPLIVPGRGALCAQGLLNPFWRPYGGMMLAKGATSFDWFFLAMAHDQLGHHDEARKLYDQAVVWMDANASDNEELRRFRAEAEDVLKLARDGTAESSSTPQETD